MSISGFILRNSKDLSALSSILEKIPIPTNSEKKDEFVIQTNLVLHNSYFETENIGNYQDVSDSILIEKNIDDEINNKKHLKLDQEKKIYVSFPEYVSLYFGYAILPIQDDLTCRWRDILLYLYKVQKKGKGITRSMKQIAYFARCSVKTVQRFLEFNKENKYLLFHVKRNFKNNENTAHTYFLHPELLKALDWIHKNGALYLMHSEKYTEEELQIKTRKLIQLSMNNTDVHTINIFIKPLPAKTKEPMSKRIKEFWIYKDPKAGTVHNLLKEMPLIESTKVWITKNFRENEIATMKELFYANLSNGNYIRCADAWAKHRVKEIRKENSDPTYRKEKYMQFSGSYTRKHV